MSMDTLRETDPSSPVFAYYPYIASSLVGATVGEYNIRRDLRTNSPNASQ